MNEDGNAVRDRPTAGDRTSRLSEAILRINENFDFDSVLQEAVDGARKLTGSRYGGMAVIDGSGDLQSFVTSGFDPEEQRQFMSLPDGHALFEHFTRLSEPIRIPDFRALARSLGFPDLKLPMRVGERFSFLAVPLLYGGESSGNIYLAEKEGGGEYNQEDEETLSMFAAQAALVIANARRYRDERQARAALETLIDTSPVGVTVFDARTGAPVSFNREAVRIMQQVQLPDRPLEDLLEVFTVRRADGRQFSLAELPFASLLVEGERIRAEEMVLSVPDGRSVTVLVNITPMHSEDGEVEWTVVITQDMTPMEEMERLRAEFLGMVSHELRAPLSSIRGSADTLLESFNSLDPAETVQFLRIIKSQSERMRELVSELLDVARIETGTLSVTPEPAEVAALVDEARTTFQSGGGRNNVAIDLEPDLPWVMADRRRIAQVLGNLLTNADRYSQESAAIRVNASLDGGHVTFEVADEGRGVAPERLPLLFVKFSRLDDDGQRRFTDSGMGLAICKGIVEAHGGRIWAESAGVDRGTRVTFTVPVAEGASGTATPPGNGRQLRAGRQDGPRPRILVVDDDPQMLRYFRDALMAEGYAPVVTGDPNDVATLVRTKRPALVILDLRLPEVDGIELMEATPELADLPVIFISAYGRDETIARALDSGAADYIVKPFSRIELTARVRAALRHHGDFEPFLFGKVAIAYDERRVTVAGRSVKLTATEYELLRVLSLNAGGVVTYDALLRQAWGRHWRSASDRKLVQAVVKRLRRKLGDDAATPAYILSERGVGYRMPRPDDSFGGST